jgi:hypothetical protein
LRSTRAAIKLHTHFSIRTAIKTLSMPTPSPDQSVAVTHLGDTQGAIGKSAGTADSDGHPKFDAEWADLRSPPVAAKDAVDRAPGVSNPVGEDEPSHPLSAAQQVIWFEQMLLPGVPFANIGIAGQINGSIDPALLEAAINQVVAVHDATRLVLCGGHGVARQRVLPHA